MLSGVEYMIPPAGAVARLNVKTGDIVIVLEDVASWLVEVKLELLAVIIAVRSDDAETEVITVRLMGSQ